MIVGRKRSRTTVSRQHVLHPVPGGGRSAFAGARVSNELRGSEASEDHEW